MNKELIQKEIKECKEKLEKLEKQLNYKGRWVPEYDESYYYVDHEKDVMKVLNEETQTDLWNIESRNCFKTRQEAQEYEEYLETKYELMDLAEELNNGVEIDWEDEEQIKYFLYYDSSDKKICLGSTGSIKRKDIYCLKVTIYEKAIEKIGEEILIKYLKY